MTANNERRVRQSNENWESIFNMMFGHSEEDKNLLPPLGSETRSSSLHPNHYTILPSSLLNTLLRIFDASPTIKLGKGNRMDKGIKISCKYT